MYRALVLTLLLTATFVPTLASATVDPCDRYGVCVYQDVGTDQVCAGVGLGLQGVGACADVEDLCARVSVGFNREEVCAGATIVLP